MRKLYCNSYSGETKYCLFCKNPITKTGRRIQQHHILGRRNAEFTVRVHKKCHVNYHKKEKKGYIDTDLIIGLELEVPKYRQTIYRVITKQNSRQHRTSTDTPRQ
jgi:hypothetical protein